LNKREGSDMKVLVVFDSVFGNTEKVARSIFGGLGSQSDAEILQVNQAVPGKLKGLDLLVVGSPTRGFRPTEAMGAWLEQIPAKSLKGVKLAVFDTRLKADEIKSIGVRFIVEKGGYAARRIAGGLKRSGGTLIVPPEGFYVQDREGPLKEGELERAASWAANILKSIQEK